PKAPVQPCLVIRAITERGLRRWREQFPAMASPELRPPLTALHGCLDMITRVLPPDAGDRARHYADLGLAQSRRLATLVNDLVDVARRESGKLSLDFGPVHLREGVAPAGEMAQPRADGQ